MMRLHSSSERKSRMRNTRGAELRTRSERFCETASPSSPRRGSGRPSSISSPMRSAGHTHSSPSRSTKYSPRGVTGVSESARE